MMAYNNAKQHAQPTALIYSDFLGWGKATRVLIAQESRGGRATNQRV